jgi:hypothetical protein
MEKSSIEVWLSVNDDGDAGVSLEGSTESREALVEEFGGAAIRTVKVTVSMAPPEITEVDVDVPDQAGETQKVEVEAA